MSTRTRSRLLMALAALIMLPAFVAPLWTIGLVAPQYPDGLGMYIYVDDIVGHDRHDIQNINILNHYIGMQEIDPETVGALDIMPIVLAGLVITGLVVALIGTPWLMVGWLILFLVAGAAGMAEFYAWNIDYGHNLSPDAAIKIPDMTYSPPIIGTEQILNIRASSWPHLGTLFLTISALLGGLATWLGFRARRQGQAQSQEKSSPPGGNEEAEPATRTREASTSRSGLTTGGIALVILGLVALPGCGEGASNGEDRSLAQANSRATVPAEDRMVYGEDQDPFCGDAVDTERWGGEVRSPDGEVLRFRSTECLAAFVLSARHAGEDPGRVRVVDFAHGWQLIDVERARFLHTPNLGSPDRLNLHPVAEDNEHMIRNLHDAYPGDFLAWEEVLELVSREWDDRIPGEGAS